MQADELRALQAPIKERYRNDPGAAVVKAVATALDVSLKDARVFAEGDLDFRGTLGIAKDAPVRFREIRLKFELDSSSSKDQLQKLIELTERYCVVLQTIRNTPPVRVS